LRALVHVGRVLDDLGSLVCVYVDGLASQLLFTSPLSPGGKSNAPSTSS
jgi:hypothetical protein